VWFGIWGFPIPTSLASHAGHFLRDAERPFQPRSEANQLLFFFPREAL
jgi:hypothetical protein